MPVTLILQSLPFFLDANSIERIAIDVCTTQGEEKLITDLLLELSRVNTYSLERW